MRHSRIEDDVSEYQLVHLLGGQLGAIQQSVDRMHG